MKKLFKWKITITLETETEIETQVVAESVKKELQQTKKISKMYQTN